MASGLIRLAAMASGLPGTRHPFTVVPAHGGTDASGFCVAFAGGVCCGYRAAVSYCHYGVQPPCTAAASTRVLFSSSLSCTASSCRPSENDSYFTEHNGTLALAGRGDRRGARWARSRSRHRRLYAQKHRGDEVRRSWRRDVSSPHGAWNRSLALESLGDVERRPEPSGLLDFGGG